MSPKYQGCNNGYSSLGLRTVPYLGQRIRLVPNNVFHMCLHLLVLFGSEFYLQQHYRLNFEANPIKDEHRKAGFGGVKR